MFLLSSERIASFSSIVRRLPCANRRGALEIGVACSSIGSRSFYGSSQYLLESSSGEELEGDRQPLSHPSNESLARSGGLLKFASETHPILQSSSLQHRFKSWQEKRRDKLTASTFAAAVGFWPRRRTQLWLEKIGAIEPFRGSLATCWNNINEMEALKRYITLTENDVLLPHFQIYGENNNNPEDSWLAASPDGLVSDFPSGGVLEIKCPYFDDGNKSRGFPWRRIPLYCIPQAQGLMEIMDRDWMDFYVWTPNGSSLFRLYRDPAYWEALKVVLCDFWWNHVQPAKEIRRKYTIINPLIELRLLRPAPRHELCSYIVTESKRVVDNSELLIRETNAGSQM